MSTTEKSAETARRVFPLERHVGPDTDAEFAALVDATCSPTAKEIDRLRSVVAELMLYFTSGNGVPVERATILAKDFWRITGLPPNA